MYSGDSPENGEGPAWEAVGWRLANESTAGIGQPRYESGGCTLVDHVDLPTVSWGFQSPHGRSVLLQFSGHRNLGGDSASADPGTIPWSRATTGAPHAAPDRSGAGNRLHTVSFLVKVTGIEGRKQQLLRLFTRTSPYLDPPNPLWNQPQRPSSCPRPNIYPAIQPPTIQR